MIKVTLIGTGNVASHLKDVFAKTDIVDVEMLSSRGDLLSKIDQKVNNNEESDIYVIAVSDDAIYSVSQQFKNVKNLVVHTSGSVAMNILPEEKRRGVFYPLQTFSKERKVDFQSIPICIEAEINEDLILLENLASVISNSVHRINSEQRKSLHLAAVFVNNFTNHLFQIGNEICKNHKVSFDILKPLITETTKKINTLSPMYAQSGPARRGDKKTIEDHLARLEKGNHKKIYKALTKSILNTYGKKL